MNGTMSSKSDNHISKQKSCFVLEDSITFGLRPVNLKRQLSLSLGDCSKHYAFLQRLNEEVIKRRIYSSQIFCSTVPLQGATEMELEVVHNDDFNLCGFGREFSFGVMGCPKDISSDHEKSKMHYRGTELDVMWQHGYQLVSSLHKRPQRYYGDVDLYHIRSGDRVGLKVDGNGELTFFMNGKSQGVAASGVYSKHGDQEVYVIVGVSNNDYSVRITRAGITILVVL